MAPERHRIGTPRPSVPLNTGPLASAAWLVARDISPTEPRWFVEVIFDDVREMDRESTTRFQLEIYAEEWGYMFRHHEEVSWIRVTDVAFVHGRDDHHLLRETPKLGDIGRFIRALESRFEIKLLQHPPLVRTSLQDAEDIVSRWARSL